MIPRGQSLPEYVLPLALVVGISGLIAWGLTQQGGIQAQIQGSVQGNRTGKVVQVATLGALPAGATVMPYGTRTAVLPLANGQTITLPNIPDNLAETLETAGGSGTTHAMGQLIRDLAEKMKDTLQPEQYNALISLSDRAFDMAAEQKILETAMRNLNLDERFPWPAEHTTGSVGLSIYVDRNNFLSSQRVQDPAGNTISITDLARRLGFYNPDVKSIPLSLTEGGTPKNPGRTMAAFLGQLQVAKQTGALDDPAVNQLIGTLSSRIAILGELSESFTTSEQMGQAVAVTRSDATHICDVGQGNSDTGVSCTQ
jgi:hypothetical protein